MTQSPYATTAYSSANLQRHPADKPRPGLKPLVGQRLPWGNTQDAVLDSFIVPKAANVQ
tara:strand:- start:240 stop:416 length:177 start_codon:yes stop_codon:yes gene_type:complete